jgi:pimeloyl-ACP methyl ester carboxylesterase
MLGNRRLRLLFGVCLIVCGCSMAAADVTSWADDCDSVPTGVETTDYRLYFTVPPGLMPDRQFDGRPAELEVHRIRPVYADKCASVPSRAAVLIHGRVATGPVAFDLRHRAPGGTLSVQETLAWAGIDTFAPSLLGYGRSTTFETGLDDPGNASLRPIPSDGAPCPYPEGCDHTHNAVFPVDQQGTSLLVNPLDGQRRAHSSAFRFARIDVWVRDIRQVIDDAIARAQPTDSRVTLVGYSLGAMRVGRSLYAAKFPEIVEKVNRVVFLSPVFGGPTEEEAPPDGFVSFPMTVTDRATVVQRPNLSDEREALCSGYNVAGSAEQLWLRLMEHETVGRNWGGEDPTRPEGLLRSPTFSGYGWNSAVAGQLTPPTLVMQGVDDTDVPGGAGNAPAVYNALPAAMTNKVLVQLDCATHEMLLEGCSKAVRCAPTSSIPYGGRPDEPWAGPHSTVKAALIEWINSGTFNGAPNGKFMVDASGVARRN